MLRENVAGDTEDEYFENGLWTFRVADRGGGIRGLTSKTVTIRDQYGVLIQRTGVVGNRDGGGYGGKGDMAW